MDAPLLIALAAITLLILCYIIVALGNRHDRKCPKCGRYGLDWIDSHVFYDPGPERTLHRCCVCRAEFVDFEHKWIPRSEWDDAEDQRLFDEL